MEFNLETIVFYFLAAFITVFSILTVTTKRMVRSATYLLFVLFGTAGIYFLLGYTFLGSVQIMVYAGGIVVLYVFSILLTSGEGDMAGKLKRSKFLAGLGTTVAGAVIVLFITLKHKFIATTDVAPLEVNIKTIALFSIAISAAETAVAIAIMINIYRNIRSIQVNKLDELKW